MDTHLDAERLAAAFRDIGYRACAETGHDGVPAAYVQNVANMRPDRLRIAPLADTDTEEQGLVVSIGWDSDKAAHHIMAVGQTAELSETVTKIMIQAVVMLGPLRPDIGRLTNQLLARGYAPYLESDHSHPNGESLYVTHPDLTGTVCIGPCIEDLVQGDMWPLDEADIWFRDGARMSRASIPVGDRATDRLFDMVVAMLGTAPDTLNVTSVAEALRAEGVPAQFGKHGVAWVLHIGTSTTNGRGHGSWPLTLGPCRPDGAHGPFLAHGEDVTVRRQAGGDVEVWPVPQHPWATTADIVQKIMTMVRLAPPAGFDRDRVTRWMTGTSKAALTNTVANLAMFPDQWRLWVDDADGYLHDVCDLVHAAVRDRAVALPDGVSDVRAWHVHDATESWPWESGHVEPRSGTVAFVITLTGNITLVTGRCDRSTFHGPAEGLEGALHALEVAMRKIHAIVGCHQTRYGTAADS
ncbi:hypothetical protein [Catellatospora methionotrophica]|uniref:hypothetical protein n=1 Tax=Catellatospora methionotrophica TaxID=121620 RepID=UPI0033CAC42C